MGTNEYSQPASKSWDSQDLGDNSMVSKMAHFRKSTVPQWVKKDSWDIMEKALIYSYISQNKLTNITVTSSDAKPLPVSMLTYNKRDPGILTRGQCDMKYSKY